MVVEDTETFADGKHSGQIEIDHSDTIVFPMNIEKIWGQKPLYYKFVKRLFDITASIIALLILSPICLITIFAILLEDGNPVFFTQGRMGKDMQEFKFYKFRSMFKGAHKQLKDLLKDNEQTGHAFKIKNDPRITKVGKFIRRFSIDEIPQFVNIIKGDMSIVGPRPILTWQMEECDKYQQQRLVVRPGLTCYWQVSGRASIKWDEWVELDLKYIRDMSLWTDLKIIIMTIPAIFIGDGAE